MSLKSLMDKHREEPPGSKPKILFLISHERQGSYLATTTEAMCGNPPQPGVVSYIQVTDDDWCDLPTGKGTCNCSPEGLIVSEQ